MNFSPIHIGGRTKVNPEEVILLEADINYTILHLSDGKKLIVATPLKTLANRFQSDGFFRTHKSFMTNLLYVVNFDEEQNKVFLQNDLKAKVSRRKRDSFVDSFKHFNTTNLS